MDNPKEEVIKPKMVKDDAFELLHALYGFEGGSVSQMNGYDDLNYHYTQPVIVQNPNINSICPHGYILKIINSEDSKHREIQEAQAHLMLFLGKRDIVCPVPVKNKQGTYFSLEKLPLKQENGVKQREHIVKLLEFQPGKLLKFVDDNYSLYYQIGVIAAKLNKAAKDFHHEAYDKHQSIWHLNSLSKAKSHISVVKNAELREMMERTIAEFEEEVLTKMDQSQSQIIHGDLNSQNIICQEENQNWKITAIIDFGDSHKSYPLFELAISMFYTMLDCKTKKMDHFVGAGHTLAGYVNTDRNFKIDYLLLKQCISARLCQSYILGKYNELLQPDNSYISECLEVYPQMFMELTTNNISYLKELWGNITTSYTTSSL